MSIPAHSSSQHQSHLCHFYFIHPFYISDNEDEELIWLRGRRKAKFFFNLEYSDVGSLIVTKLESIAAQKFLLIITLLWQCSVLVTEVITREQTEHIRSMCPTFAEEFISRHQKLLSIRYHTLEIYFDNFL